MVEIKEKSGNDFRKELYGPPPHVILGSETQFFFKNPDEEKDSQKIIGYHLPDNVTAKGTLFSGEPDKEEDYVAVTVSGFKRAKESSKEIEEINKFTVDFKNNIVITNLNKIYVKFGEIEDRLERKLSREEKKRRDLHKKMGESWGKRYRSPLPEDDQ